MYSVNFNSFARGSNIKIDCIRRRSLLFCFNRNNDQFFPNYLSAFNLFPFLRTPDKYRFDPSPSVDINFNFLVTRRKKINSTNNCHFSTEFSAILSILSPNQRTSIYEKNSNNRITFNEENFGRYRKSISLKYSSSFELPCNIFRITELPNHVPGRSRPIKWMQVSGNLRVNAGA